MAVTVTVSTNNGIDLRFNTLYNEFANSPTQPGSATQYTAADTGAYDGTTLPIVFVISGTGLTYSGSFPNAQLTGGTITSVVEQDTSNNTLVTFSGFNISATTFQSAMNTYTSGHSSNTSSLNSIFRTLQYNTTGGGGSDTLQGGNLADTVNGGDGSDVFVSSRGDDTINGGNGFDNASYIGVSATAPITAMLSSTSTVVGDTSVGTDTLTSVERVRGTELNDTFTMTSSFVGSFGNFAAFEGGPGNDTINGSGTDGATRAEYLLAASGVFVDLANGTAHSIAAGDAANIGVDTLNGVTGVTGSQFDDQLTAAGGRGQFQFFGIGGNDTITGTSEGINNFDYNLARYDQTGIAAGVAVSLGPTSTVTGDASVGTDTLINIEAVRGTPFADTFVVNPGFSAEYGAFNSFEGLGGNDTVTGNGETRLEYGNALAAVTVNFATGTATSTAGGDAAGIGTDSFSGVNNVDGSAFDDTLIGSDGPQAERFHGSAGNDLINGAGGALDNVDYRGSPAGVSVDLSTGGATDGLGGIDTLVAIEGARGSEFSDVLVGDANDNQLVGQAGDDALFGGGGNDILVGDDTFDPWGGAFGTSVSFDSGNDTLDGGAGNDTMYGGPGNDLYYVQDIGDTIVENPGEGSDSVIAFVTYTLPANVETIYTLAGSGATGNGGDNLLDGAYAGSGQTLDGQGGNDVIYGTFFNDTLIGGTGSDALYDIGGSDTMQGGAGDDAYFVNSTADVVQENAGEGQDAIYASVNFTLPTNVEILEPYSAATRGDGNDDANVLLGVASDHGLTLDGHGGNDVIYGSNFDDTLIGGAGDDLLWGFGGNDTMQGGTGNDTYIVEQAGDVVQENPAEGNDTIYASVNITLPTNVENLFVYGAATSGIGNAADNYIVNEFITSGVTLTGAGGNDTFVFIPGTANNTTITDFAGNGAGVGDVLEFAAYGAGATFTNIDTTHWQVNYGAGLSQHDVITFSNAAAIDPSDVLFV